MVYLSDHPSSALLETIVHIDREYLPANFQLLCIEAPDSLPVDAVNLPDGWQDEPAETQAIGEWFLKKRIAPLLRVPSVIMPQALNFLLNPNHPDSSKVQIAQIWRYPFDSRLLM